MNPFLLPPNERLSKWRDFRNSTASLSEQQQLESVARFFAQCPTSNYSIDWDNPASWPTPWELLHEGHPCLSGVAYLMERTLVMMGWNANRINLVYVNDSAQEDTRMLVTVDRQHVLNYNVGEVDVFDLLAPNVVELTRYVSTENGYLRI